MMLNEATALVKIIWEYLRSDLNTYEYEEKP